MRSTRSEVILWLWSVQKQGRDKPMARLSSVSTITHCLFRQSNARPKFKILSCHHLFPHYIMYINLRECCEHILFSKSKGKSHFQGSHTPYFGQWILYFFLFHIRICNKNSLKISEKRQSFLPIFSSLINRIDLLSQPACKRSRKKNKSKNYTEYTANEISKSIDKIQ